MYEELGLAIVGKAVEDYMNAKRNVRNHFHVEHSLWVIQDVERFIKSEWFGVLCNLDRNYILETMKAM